MNNVQQKLVQADTNYGTVGNKTTRTAAQIGNRTGQADFGAGAPTAQTLRVALASGAVVGITPVSSGVYTYDELPATPAGSTAEVVHHVTTSIFFLKRVTASGDSDAEFVVKINTVTVAKKRNNWTERNVDFDFGDNGIRVQPSDVVRLYVTNKGKTTSKFNGTLYGEEV